MKRKANNLFTRGDKALEKGEYEIAEKCYSKVAGQEGNLKEAALWNLGITQECLGKHREADKNYHRSLQVHNNTKLDPIYLDRISSNWAKTIPSLPIKESLKGEYRMENIKRLRTSESAQNSR